MVTNEPTWDWQIFEIRISYFLDDACACFTACDIRLVSLLQQGRSLLHNVLNVQECDATEVS